MIKRLYYPNGKLYALIGKERREYFYENGNAKTIENYRNGRLEGEALLYWPNGKLKRRCSFGNGVREGIDQMWNEEGTLVDEGGYSQGKPIGMHRRFGKEGNLIEEIVYLDGTRFNLRQWGAVGELRVEAIWEDLKYREKTWDRFQNIWIEKEGRWDGKKLVYV